MVKIKFEKNPFKLYIIFHLTFSTIYAINDTLYWKGSFLNFFSYFLVYTVNPFFFLFKLFSLFREFSFLAIQAYIIIFLFSVLLATVRIKLKSGKK